MAAQKNNTDPTVAAAASSDVEQRTLRLSRLYQAPRELVYKAWTEPERMLRWFGPAGAQTLEAESDPRVGGRYRVLMRTSDGLEHEVTGVYRDVILHEKLVFTWTWRSRPERESLVTVRFTSEGTATRLDFKHEHFFDELERDDHQFGWTGALENLAASLG